jgi:mRNA-degrading endonuclease RelE of RelBE toxin-antitoxin system
MLALRGRSTAALTHGAALTQNPSLFTVIETPVFSRLWTDYWDEDERGEFVAWLVENAELGDVIRGSGGCRKVRWKRPGRGKRGGVRVIYYNRIADEVIYLLLIYAKGVRDDIGAKTLDRIRRTLDGEDD